MVTAEGQGKVGNLGAMSSTLLQHSTLPPHSMGKWIRAGVEGLTHPTHRRSSVSRRNKPCHLCTFCSLWQ